MSSPKSIFICLWVIFMYLPLSPDPFQEEAIFQNSKCFLSTFLAANSSSNFSFLFDLKIKHFPNSNSICNLFNSWGPNKSRDTLCFFTFWKTTNRPGLDLGNLFRRNLPPYLFFGLPLGTLGISHLGMEWAVKLPLSLHDQCFCGWRSQWLFLGVPTISPGASSTDFECLLPKNL